MRRALAFGVRALRPRTVLALLGWSVPEMLAAALSGVAVARAVDAGFLAGRPGVGLAWLGVLGAGAVAAAAGTRQVYRRLGDLAEPFRDSLVRRVVGGALLRGVRGLRDDGAIARLTHQVEIARDTFAGLVMVIRGFLVTVVGAVVGMFSLAPAVAAVVLPAFALGVGAFVATLGAAAQRQRAYVRTDEELSVRAAAALHGVRDVVARGAEEYTAATVDAAAADHAGAERALARVAAVRAVCLAVGGWVPLVALLAAGGWLARGGLSAGELVGGLTYVLAALQPALASLIRGMGGGGLRFVITVERILERAERRPAAATADRAGRASRSPGATRGGRPGAASGAPLLVASGVTFRYGPHAAPILQGLDLELDTGEHLAVVGPSGIGKSTLAGLLCGLIRPDAGDILLRGVPVTALSARQLAARRALIPQEAYLFTGSLWDNLTYLRPKATAREVRHAVRAVGAQPLVERLGGCRAAVRPEDLSAGERQLVALARAYLSPAPLAVLDEATSYLDPATERRAEEAFASRPGALVVIAHRMSSAMRARRVLVLDGADAVLGDQEEVRARSPLYRSLVGHWWEPARSSRVAARSPASGDLTAPGSPPLRSS